MKQEEEIRKNLVKSLNYIESKQMQVRCSENCKLLLSDNLKFLRVCVLCGNPATDLVIDCRLVPYSFSLSTVSKSIKFKVHDSILSCTTLVYCAYIQ